MKCARAISSAVLGTLALAGPALATTPTETVLYSFRGDRSGSQPYASLISDKSGALYGTTSGIGSKSLACGSAFQLTPPTGKKRRWLLHQLHAFVRETGDGCTPLGGLVADPSGVLYGTTTVGGANNSGIVFALTPPAARNADWTEAIIYSFTQFATPDGSLIRDAKGVLYGTTSSGGATANGTVFAVAPPGKGQTSWTETTLHSFQGGADGRGPTSALVKDATGALYGTTYYGGGGAICQGGQGCGTVFKLTPPAAGQTTWTETLLWSFSGGADGSNPYAGLLLKNGILYGTTKVGGDVDGGTGDGAGVIFYLSPPAAGQSGWTESVIHTFSGAGADGGFLYSGLITDPSGVLYGTTEATGTGCCGTVFQLTPPAAGQTGWTETTLYNFVGGSSGAYPYGGLVRDAAKNLFGTTSEGGTNSFGTVFEITP